MSYQIIYDSKDTPTKHTSKKSVQTGLAIGVLSIILLGALRVSGIAGTLWQALIPGDPAVTTAAFHTMADHLQNGQSISDAVFAFCEAVIEGAQLG